MSRTLRSPRHEALRLLLIQMRKRAELTQSDVAKKLGRYQSFVAYVESGERRIDVIEFLDFAEAIGFNSRDALKRIEATKRR